MYVGIFKFGVFRGRLIIHFQLRVPQCHQSQYLWSCFSLAGINYSKTLSLGCSSRSFLIFDFLLNLGWHRSDVVPVESQTIKEWKHGPYSGYYDGRQTLYPREALYPLIIPGTWIWGRGSCDDKSDLIRQLLAIDSLLKQGFSPARTLILSYGFDEESKGTEVRSTSTWKSHYQLVALGCWSSCRIFRANVRTRFFCLTSGRRRYME